eukprot:4814859-Pyramimonas_sp.AAC.1
MSVLSSTAPSFPEGFSSDCVVPFFRFSSFSGKRHTVANHETNHEDEPDDDDDAHAGPKAASGTLQTARNDETHRPTNGPPEAPA